MAEIRAQVTQALEHYEQGNADDAYEVAVSAYLDGFEHVEDDLRQHGEEELMETLEHQFKDLRDGIKAGKSLDDVQALAADINANLDRVETLLK